MTVASLTLTTPTGGAWEFLVLFLVVIIGPPIMQRARVPGLVGLLLGGYVIGPHGLGLIDSGSTTIPDLGAVGLLYLMFVAGVELDLSLLRKYRSSAVTFGLLTFFCPAILGFAVGTALGWKLSAAILLGALLASHTLVLYPLIRHARLSNDPVIASALGGTVLTDTLTLTILAVISSTTSGSGGPVSIALQLLIGFAVLGVVCFVVLPWVVSRAFWLLGAERTVRYVITVAGFLTAAVVGQLFGIDGIIGAFFAGLSLNRLVPNEGPLMHRIDFFGSAVFVPVFLVSVGLLLNPAVMIEGQTLGLAGLFVAAALAGKFIAAQLTRPLYGADGAKALLVFALTTPRAAATLAATTVGFNIGLFGESVVNAVLVVILVTMFVSTLIAERQRTRVEPPPIGQRALGEHVLVAVAHLDGAPLGLRIARRVADHQAGIVEVFLMEPARAASRTRQADLDRLNGLCRRLSIDTDPAVRVTDHMARAAVLAANDVEASLVIAVENNDHERWAETLALVVPAPVVVVRGAIDQSLSTMRFVGPTPPDDPAGAIAAELMATVPARAEHASLEDAQTLGGLEPGDVAIAVVNGWDPLTGLHPPEGAAMVLVPDGLLPSAPPEVAAYATSGEATP
jgi:Kef-type K+ transport system membrane component KefB